MHFEQAIELLEQHWGHRSFRPNQEAILKSILAGNNTLGLLPTGGGKSICFQIPALIAPGLTVVISPLIALMNDQVHSLRKRGIKAEMIGGNMTLGQIETAIDNCIYGNSKLLYLSPERLKSSSLKQRLQSSEISYLVVDEAHCISQWGHDFRPAYREIKQWLSEHCDAQMIALTGTATKRVEKDIVSQLGIENECNVLRFSFERKNINYRVFNSDDKRNELVALVKKLGTCGIVYTRSRRKTEELDKHLRSHGHNSAYYHAGLNPKERRQVEKDWIGGKTNIVIATNAFGMGIDKASVDFVIHMDLPNNLEEYLQESGRAGRDGKLSEAILLFNEEDLLYQKQLFSYRFPRLKTLQSIYTDLGNFFQLGTGGAEGKGFPFDLQKFCRQFDYEPLQAHHAIKILEAEGYILLSEQHISSSKLQITADSYQVRKIIDNGGFVAEILSSLLRSYTGLFNEKQRISESFLSEQLNCSEHSIKNALQSLEKRHVVHYLKPNFYPILIYTSERIHGKNLHIQKEELNARKAVAAAQLEAIEQYLKTKRCRTALCLKYFNEELQDNCGHCDNCLKKDTIPNNIEQSILEQIKKGISLNDLLSLIDEPKEIVIESVRVLLEEKRLIRDGKLLKKPN